MRRVGLTLFVVSCSLPACQDGQFQWPEMNDVRSALGAETEEAEEGKTVGDVASSTGSDARSGIDERMGNDGSSGGSGGSGGASSSTGSSSTGSSSGGSSASASSSSGSTDSSGTSTSAAMSAPADSGAPTNRPEDVDVSGTERNGWSDADTGWMAKLEMTGGMTMTQEVVEARDEVLLMETTTEMNGQVLSRSKAWTARLHPKPQGESEMDVRTEELGSKSIDVAGSSVSCEGTKTIWMQDGKETQNVGWISEDVPGWIVLAETDAMGNGMQVTARLVEFRK